MRSVIGLFPIANGVYFMVSIKKTNGQWERILVIFRNGLGFVSTITCIRVTSSFQMRQDATTFWFLKWNNWNFISFSIKIPFPLGKILEIETRKCNTKSDFKNREIHWVRLTLDDTYPCNSLTNFEYEVRSMTGNGNYLNLLKTVWKNYW